MAAALRVLAYLSRHKHLGLRYTQCSHPLEGFADTDCAVRHTQSGFIFRLGRAAVSWGSKKQVSIALSTCEAEIMAASEAAKKPYTSAHSTMDSHKLHLRDFTSTVKQRSTLPTTQSTTRNSSKCIAVITSSGRSLIVCTRNPTLCRIR